MNKWVYFKDDKIKSQTDHVFIYVKYLNDPRSLALIISQSLKPNKSRCVRLHITQISIANYFALRSIFSNVPNLITNGRPGTANCVYTGHVYVSSQLDTVINALIQILPDFQKVHSRVIQCAGFVDLLKQLNEALIREHYSEAFEIAKQSERQYYFKVSFKLVEKLFKNYTLLLKEKTQDISKINFIREIIFETCELVCHINPDFAQIQAIHAELLIGAEVEDEVDKNSLLSKKINVCLNGNNIISALSYLKEYCHFPMNDARFDACFTPSDIVFVLADSYNKEVDQVFLPQLKVQHVSTEKDGSLRKKEVTICFDENNIESARAYLKEYCCLPMSDSCFDACATVSDIICVLADRFNKKVDQAFLSQKKAQHVSTEKDSSLNNQSSSYYSTELTFYAGNNKEQADNDSQSHKLCTLK